MDIAERKQDEADRAYHHALEIQEKAIRGEATDAEAEAAADRAADLAAEVEDLLNRD